jgi:predicted alpha/beta superfamily hydrolase
MIRAVLVSGLGFLALQATSAQDRLVKQEFTSQHLRGSRTVRIYLPASYAADLQRRYPVLYLHDGQNVFSFAGTNIAFGWGGWELDKTADQLARDGRMEEVLLVAVDNSPARYAEYCGAHHPVGTNENTAYENYRAFLIQELKPRIDAQYRTRPEPSSTGVMGSSMGGICSLILAWEHPEVFGRAASLSGAFMVEHTNFLNQVLIPCQGPSKPAWVYLDSGITDFLGGDDGRALTQQVAGELRRIGWRGVEPFTSLGALEGLKEPGDHRTLKDTSSAAQLMHFVDVKPLTAAQLEETGLRRDKWKEAQTSQHNEFYWRLRAWRPLTFLFPVR